MKMIWADSLIQTFKSSEEVRRFLNLTFFFNLVLKDVLQCARALKVVNG